MDISTQQRQLDEVMALIKHSSKAMITELEQGNILPAISHCTEILKELRASNWSPKNYYEIYIAVADQLMTLQSYLLDMSDQKEFITQLYEIVQYSNLIIPRLYLLITVGVVNIKFSRLKKKAVLTDLMEMCRGVQNPLRGLFLRSFLLRSVENSFFSDAAVEQQDDETADIPSVADAINFILSNFSEMNKLWVRMQHQGSTKLSKTREQERRDLQLLVGTNLNRLAQFEAIEAELYSTRVLPPILEQIVRCNDVIAQQYLMDCIIQVFADEFQLATFQQLIATCTKLHPAVKVCTILYSLMDRLGLHQLNELREGRTPKLPPAMAWPPVSAEQVEEDTELAATMKALENPPMGADLIGFLAGEVGQVLLRTRPEQLQLGGLTPTDVAILYQLIIFLAMHIYGEKSHDMVNYCFNCAAALLKHLGIISIPTETSLATEVLHLLNLPMEGELLRSLAGSAMSTAAVGSLKRVPISALCSLRNTLAMDGYVALVDLLEARTSKRRLVGRILASALERNHFEEAVQPADASPLACQSRIQSLAELEGLFSLMEVLFLPQTDESSIRGFESADELEDDHCSIAGIMHLLGPEPRSADVDLTFSLLSRASDIIVRGGPAILRCCYPALISETMELLKAFEEVRETLSGWEEKVEKTIYLCHGLIGKLIACEGQEAALRFYLDAALLMDQLQFARRDSLVYEFLSQAILLYEEGVSDAKSQLNALLAVISCICAMRNLQAESHATLRRHCTRAANHLLRRPDQAKAAAYCALLFWDGTPCPNADGTTTATDEESRNVDSAVQSKELGDTYPQPLHDHKEVLKCFDRASRLSNECMDSVVRVELSVDLLNLSAQLRLKGCEQLDDERFNKLIAGVEELIPQLQQHASFNFAAHYFANTIKFLREKQQEGQFTAVKLPNMGETQA